MAAGEKQTINKISEEIVRRTAAKAALAVPGVSRLSDSFTDNLTRMFYGKDAGNSGIKVNAADDGLVIDIFVIVKFGVKIPQIAWDIQNAVKSSIRKIAPIDLKAVNINVQGVDE